MKHNLKRIVAIGLLLFLATSLKSQNQLNISDFQNPPQKSKIHTWWHWLDGNITKEGISKDLEALKEQGIVQATILNIGLFGNRDFGINKVNFNTPEWYDMFQWALKEANRLGITIGAHNCDGWSTSGGPWITPEMSMKQYTWTKTIVNSKSSVVELKKPLANNNFYKDVAVIAVKNSEELNTFQKASPTVFLNENNKVEYLADGCPVSGYKIDKGNKVKFVFNTEFTVEKIAFLLRRSFMWGNPEDFTSTYQISFSSDGVNFTKISDFTVNGLNKINVISIPKTAAKYFQIEYLENNNVDGWIPVILSECELLNKNDVPLYNPEIEFLSEKSGDVKSGKQENFYLKDKIIAKTKAKEIIDISSKMKSDGTINWKPSEGNWTILRFGYTTTGSVNAPATTSGTGLECDKMDTAALNLHFKSFPAKLIEKAGKYAGNTFKFMLIDSWEAGYQNWTANMPNEFEKRCGYSLTSYIPVLCGISSGNSETDEAVLFDFRKTIAELIENNYYKHFGELLHQKKIEFHAEVIYGDANYPALDILKTTQYVDLPMYEFWSATTGDNIVNYYPSTGVELNMPACAAIGYEKPVFASEAYTGMAHYSESPKSLKLFGDKAFCTGINQMILHSYVHQPQDNKPGMTLEQWGSHFNRNNNYFSYISEWFNYQARIQNVLQQGVASHDVLYYLGDQLPQYLNYNKSNKLPFGYRFNSCNFDILKNRIKVVGKKLILNGNISYSVLSFPAYSCINFETLKRIEELVNEGLILFAPKPTEMLSLADIKNNKKAFQELVEKIWGKIDGKNITSNSYGKGKVYWGIPLKDVLKSENILPDIKTQESDSLNFLFIHKKIGEDDAYFVMNQQNTELQREVSFRVTGKTPEIWNPETGNTVKPAVFSIDKNYTTLPVVFKAQQSLIFVFRNEKPKNFIDTVKQNGTKIFPVGSQNNLKPVPEIVLVNNSYTALSSAEGTYELITNQNKNYTLNSKKIQEYEISDYKGTVSFEAGYSAKISPLEFTKLKWLTESENTDIKYFAGNSIYTISFKFPVEKFAKNDSVLLDLGEFESIASVKLNGKNLGIIWKKGEYLPVKEVLKAENVLEVSVANVYRNRFIGDFIQADKVLNLWTSSPITRFLNKNSSLIPSGLKGPLKIVVINKQCID